MYYFWHGNENPVDGWDVGINITQGFARTVGIGLARIIHGTANKGASWSV